MLQFPCPVNGPVPRLRLGTVFVLLLASCTSDCLQAEPPQEIEWIAVVQANEAGEVIAASPLLPYDGDAVSLPIAPGAVAIWSLGFTAEQIAGENSVTGD